MLAESIRESLRSCVDPMQVLDSCIQPIFFLNEQYELIYLNQSAGMFFEKNVEYFKECDPQYVPNQIGNRFSVLEKELSHLVLAIAGLQKGESLNRKLMIDRLHLECKITPIFSLDQERIGTCFELQDRTSLVRTLCILEDAIYTAENGDFDKKLSLDFIDADNQDFLLLSQKLNILFEKIQGFFGEIVCVLDDLMHGKVADPMTGQTDLSLPRFSDSFFNATKNDLNSVLNRFSIFIKNIKNLSELMRYTLDQIDSKNSLLAMATEKEQTEIQTIGTQLQQFLDQIHHNHLEIYQAVEVASSLKTEGDLIQDLRALFHSVLGDVYQRILKTLNVIKSINFKLRNHLDTLRIALNEIKIGNIGKGIYVITEECAAMIHTTNDLMQNIYHAFTMISQNVDEKQNSINENFEQLSSKLAFSGEIISMMAAILQEIQHSLGLQDHLFQNIQQSIQTVSQSHAVTYQTTQHTVLLTAVLGYLNHHLKSTVHHFDPSAESPESLDYEGEIQKILEQHHHLTETPVHSFIKLFN